MTNVNNELLNESFEEMLAESFSNTDKIEGSVVKGTVVGIENEIALIDVGLKSEGRVSIKEFTTPGQSVNIKSGDIVDVYIEKILRQISLWDKRNARNLELSGGMKKRVLIAKALSHKPKILFLDEPSAGVDVELRKDMWKLISDLKKEGVTIILTTHYIEEAEEIADRVGIISNGKLLLVEKKND